MASAFENFMDVFGLREDPNIALLKRREAFTDNLIGQRNTNVLPEGQSGPLQESNAVGLLGSINPATGFADPTELTKAKFALAGEGANSAQINDLLSQFTPPDAVELTPLERQFNAFKANNKGNDKALTNPKTNRPFTLEDFRRSGGVTVNTGGDGNGRFLTNDEKTKEGINPNSAVFKNSKGNISVVSKDKFTQPQILSGGFASRMQTASEDIAKLESTFSDSDKAGLLQNADSFGVSNVLSNFLRSDEGQQFRQAQNNWVTANLRKESGAAIPDAELENERLKWFPQPGDSEATVRQKRESRKDAENAMKRAAGGSFEEISGAKNKGGLLGEPIPNQIARPDTPAGMTDNGNGTFTLQDGRIVRKK